MAAHTIVQFNAFVWCRLNGENIRVRMNMYRMHRHCVANILCTPNPFQHLVSISYAGSKIIEAQAHLPTATFCA